MTVFSTKSIPSKMAIALATTAFLGAAPVLAQPSAMSIPPEITNFTVTEYSAGPIYLGATVGEAKRAAPNLTFKRGAGPENSIVIDVMQGNKVLMSLWTQEQVEYDERGNAPPINDSVIIEGIEILDPRFKTYDGVYIGLPMANAERALGKLKTMTNMPHMGEVPTFERQPDFLGLTVQMPAGSSSYTVGSYRRIKDCTNEYEPACMVSTTYNSGARISGMSIGLGSATNSEASPQRIINFTGLPRGYRIIREDPSIQQCERGEEVTTYKVWRNYPSSSNFTSVQVKYGICANEYAPITRQAYADQSSFYLDDFNFDGMPDLALYIGNVGGYGSMAYDVFLFDRSRIRYLKSGKFSDLTRSLGMFEVNKDDRMLFVNSKSGAAFFQREGYRVTGGNELKKVFEKTMEYTGEGQGVQTTKITMDGQEFTMTGPITE